MSMDTDRIALLIKHDRLTPVMLTYVLLEYARDDRSALEKLIMATSDQNLEWVYDVLTTYPQTDVGWEILPASRTPFLRPDLERHELADVEQRQYQDDRPHVEYLRNRIRPRP